MESGESGEDTPREESAPEDEDMAPGDEAPPGEPAAGDNTCPECGGTGKLNARICPNCYGSGTVIEAAGGG
jgi:hypothetical protein